MCGCVMHPKFNVKQEKIVVCCDTCLDLFHAQLDCGWRELLWHISEINDHSLFFAKQDTDHYIFLKFKTWSMQILRLLSVQQRNIIGLHGIIQINSETSLYISEIFMLLSNAFMLWTSLSREVLQHVLKN